MKLNFTKIALVITGILTSISLFAQTPDSTKASANYVQPFSGNGGLRTWSIGVNGGVLTTFTILGTNNNQDFTAPAQQPGYGGYIKKQITSGFGLQLNFLGGKLTADNSHPQPNSTVSEFKSFNTKLSYSASLSASIILGNISWHNNKSAIQPYVTAGAGVINYTPVVTYGDGTTINFKAGSNPSLNSAFVPIDLGLKFDIARGINLEVGYQMNFTFADNLDGFNYGGNNDKFSYGHIGLEFALGNASKPQLSAHNPVSSMREEYKTGIDHLEQEVASQKAEIAAQKAQNDKLQNDLATTNTNLAKFTKDSDGDGVPDFFDKCPNTPEGVKVDGSGCPLPKADVKVYITDEDKKVVTEAIRNLEFATGKAAIRPTSFASLDKVAKLLVDKNLSLKLAGHTDNVGSDAVNMKLSKDRAEAVKAYLAEKGVNPSRIEAIGYGSTQPIAPNTTAIGRQFNRRVEFTVF